jgi:hypothetical protein
METYMHDPEDTGIVSLPVSRFIREDVGTSTRSTSDDIRPWAHRISADMATEASPLHHHEVYSAPPFNDFT